MDADVIVVGAGAAGLAAARVFKDAGLKGVILESSGRVGGRAYTNSDFFGVPCDLGAHWLHYGWRNVFKFYGEREKFNIFEARPRYIVFNPDQPFNPSDPDANRHDSVLVDEFENQYTQFSKELSDGPFFSSDRAVGEIVDKLKQNVFNKQNALFWSDSIALNFGNWDMAKDWSDFSNFFYQLNLYDTSRPRFYDHMCAEGYGALVKRSAEGLTVEFDKHVNKISLIKDGVQVRTSKGESFSAKACVVTVSTGVLASDEIELPQEADKVKEACSALTMGNFNRVILRFSDDIFGKGPNFYAFERVGAAESGAVKSPQFVFTTKESGGQYLIYADVGGSHADSLQEASSEEMIQAALDELKHLLGTSVTTRLDTQGLPSDGMATYWHRSKRYRGAFASAKPRQRDKWHDNFKMSEAHIDDKIFFAGEACHYHDWATVSGAHQSGCATGQKIAAQLQQNYSPKLDCCSKPVEIDEDCVCAYL